MLTAPGPARSPASPCHATLARALVGDVVADRAPLDAVTRRALDGLVADGLLARGRGYPSDACTGPLRTVWFAPHAHLGAGQIHSLVEAWPAFYRAQREAEAARLAAAA